MTKEEAQDILGPSVCVVDVLDNGLVKVLPSLPVMYLDPEKIRAGNPSLGKDCEKAMKLEVVSEFVHELAKRFL